MKLPFSEKIPLPLDMVIFENAVFGKIVGFGIWPETLENREFSLTSPFSDSPKSQAQNPQKRPNFIFGECFWENGRMVPRWEVLQV